MQPIGDPLERKRLDSASLNDEPAIVRIPSFRLKCKFLPFLDNIKVNRLIKESQVLDKSPDRIWNWEIISTIISVRAAKNRIFYLHMMMSFTV